MSHVQLSKCVYPYPVYEAHFQDGSSRRMSFWTKDGQALDFGRGRKLCQNGVEMTHGLVIHGDGEIPDPHFTGEVPQAEKPKRKTAKQYRDALQGVLSGSPGAVEAARELVAA